MQGQNFINGMWRDGVAQIANINPSDTSDVIGHFAQASHEDLTESLAAARRAQAEWWAMVPQGVSVHAARVTSSTPWAEWDAPRQSVALCDDLKRGAAQFASMGLSAVVVAHSSSSVAGGQGWDEAVVESLRAVLDAKTQVTTNGADCTLALRHLGVRRPFSRSATPP